MSKNSPCPTECLNEILAYLENDKSSLHSCLLVNRLWCRITVPILWSRSFTLMQNSSSATSVPSINLTKIYLSFLNEEEKQLRNCYPELYPISKKTLFNYPSYLKEFNYESMFTILKFWIRTCLNLNISTNNTIQRYDNQYYTRTMNKACFALSQSLFKMFLRNNAQANMINIQMFEEIPDLPYFPYLQSSLFSNLKSFQFSIDERPLYKLPNVYSFLKSISRSCKSLTHVYIDSHFNDDREEIFFNIFKNQKYIKKLAINPHHGIIPKSILNSIIDQSFLVLIHFIDTHFIDSFPFEILSNCGNLKFLVIVNCRESNFKQITITEKDVKCKILNLHLKNNDFLPLTTLNLMQLSGNHLTTLWFMDKIRSHIILSKPLSTFCPNITHLIITPDSSSLSLSNHSFSTLISNLNLIYLGIRSFAWTNDFISELGNYLPNSLKYLELSAFFDMEPLRILLQTCKCQLKGLSMIFFNENYLNLIVDYAKLHEEFKFLGIDEIHSEFLSEGNEEKMRALKILKEETNVKIVDQDDIKLKSSYLNHHSSIINVFSLDFHSY